MSSVSSKSVSFFFFFFFFLKNVTMNKLSRLGPVLLLPPAQFKRPRCSVYWIQFCCYRPHSSNGHVGQYIGFSSVATARTVQTATLFSISDSVLLLPPAQFKRLRCSVYRIQFCCYRPHSSNGYIEHLLTLQNSVSGMKMQRWRMKVVNCVC